MGAGAMTDDLKERLRAKRTAKGFCSPEPGVIETVYGDDPLTTEALARITDLEARLAAAEAERDALVGAVKVLADHAKDRCADDAAWLDTDTVTVSVSIGDLRNSLAAYEERRKRNDP